MDYSRTGSSRGVYKRNGEIMAIPHAGIEASWALNEKTAARGQTQSTMKDSFKDPNLKQALTAYHPNAQRSRMPVQFKNEAKPFKRFCQVRNQHTYNFFDKGTGAGYVRFRTTSQNYYDYDTKALSVGESNQGIVSEKSKWIHQKQTM
mmetsp:Transcript_8414/g.18763  ORF Transcript_8414/g.18763 Transcript_8414/m.18763 type:complete len:148 (-) Transcript_8414:154-597(-)